MTISNQSVYMGGKLFKRSVWNLHRTVCGELVGTAKLGREGRTRVYFVGAENDLLLQGSQAGHWETRFSSRPGDMATEYIEDGMDASAALAFCNID